MTDDRHDYSSFAAFEGKGILITGGAGYLASCLVSLLKDVNCRILRLDRDGARWEPVSGRARIVDLAGDVSEPSIWNGLLEEVDFVFHFAAQTSAYVANDKPVADLSINVMPMLHLLEECRRVGRCPVVCFSSTVTVAGIPEHLPVSEKHPDHPITIYDLHKKMSEQYLRWYTEQGAVRGVSLRLANLYGPGPSSSSSDRGILNQMIRRALAGEALTVYGSGDFLRDYVYVEDAARAFISAASHCEILNGGYFVIGSGCGHPFAEAMKTIAEHCSARTGKHVEIRHIEPPSALSPIEQRQFVADSGLFSRITGWYARYDLAKGIERTLEAFS